MAQYSDHHFESALAEAEGNQLPLSDIAQGKNLSQFINFSGCSGLSIDFKEDMFQISIHYYNGYTSNHNRLDLSEVTDYLEGLLKEKLLDNGYNHMASDKKMWLPNKQRREVLSKYECIPDIASSFEYHAKQNKKIAISARAITQASKLEGFERFIPFKNQQMRNKKFTISEWASSYLANI